MVSRKKKEELVSETENIFSVDILRANCRALFGVSQGTFDGAICSLVKDKMYSVNEIITVIENWKGRVV